MQFKQIIAEDRHVIAYLDNLKLLPTGLSADLTIVEKKSGRRLTSKIEGVKINLWDAGKAIMDILTGQKKVNKTEIYAKALKSVFGIIDFSRKMDKKELKK